MLGPYPDHGTSYPPTSYPYGPHDPHGETNTDQYEHGRKHDNDSDLDLEETGYHHTSTPSYEHTPHYPDSTYYDDITEETVSSNYPDPPLTHPDSNSAESSFDRCRADDKVRCPQSPHVTICASQICDGQPDCPGGTDEMLCPDGK